jgi:hypothetical protein
MTGSSLGCVASDCDKRETGRKQPFAPSTEGANGRNEFIGYNGCKLEPKFRKIGFQCLIEKIGIYTKI